MDMTPRSSTEEERTRSANISFNRGLHLGYVRQGFKMTTVKMVRQILVSHLGSQGRILAETNPRVLQELLSFSGGGSSISLRGDAVRAEHLPQDLHQDGRCSDEGVASKRRKIFAYLDEWIIGSHRRTGAERP